MPSIYMVIDVEQTIKNIFGIDMARSLFRRLREDRGTRKDFTVIAIDY